MLKASTVFVPIIVIMSCSQLFAGGWNQYREKGFFKIGSSDFHAEEYILPNGRAVDINTYHAVTLSISGEYGLDNDFTAHFYFPFFKEVSLSTLRNTGPSDAIMGLRYGIVQTADIGWNAGVTMRVPFGDSDDQNNVALGVQDFPVYLSTQFGHTLPWERWYAIAEVGINIRMNWFPYELHTALELGAPISKQFLFIGRLESMWALGNGDFDIVPVSAGYNGNAVNQTQLMFKLMMDATSEWGYIAEYSRPVHGRSVLFGPTLAFGVYRRIL